MQANCQWFCTCSGSWIGVSHVAGSRGRALEESILLRRGLVCIAGRSRWRWAVAIHNARRRVAVRGSAVLCGRGARSWNEKEKGDFHDKGRGISRGYGDSLTDFWQLNRVLREESTQKTKRLLTHPHSKVLRSRNISGASQGSSTLLVFRTQCSNLEKKKKTTMQFVWA